MYRNEAPVVLYGVRCLFNPVKLALEVFLYGRGFFNDETPVRRIINCPPAELGQVTKPLESLLGFKDDMKVIDGLRYNCDDEEVIDSYCGGDCDVLVCLVEYVCVSVRLLIAVLLQILEKGGDVVMEVERPPHNKVFFIFPKPVPGGECSVLSHKELTYIGL